MDTFIHKLLSKNKNIGVYPLHEYWLDIGKIDDFKQAEIDIASGDYKIK